jgi:hypothetical protein
LLEEERSLKLGISYEQILPGYETQQAIESRLVADALYSHIQDSAQCGRSRRRHATVTQIGISDHVPSPIRYSSYRSRLR